MAPPSAARPLNPKGTWRTYAHAEGLAGLQTEHIAEDAEGYLWIGTWDNGACRFDGDEFRTFTTRDGLPSNRVQAILLDRQGRLWFGTDGGVCWYDRKEFHRLGSEDSASGKPISFLFEDQKGRLWFGGYEALGYFDGTRVRDLVPDYIRQYGAPSSWSSQCLGITRDREGSLWVGGFGNDTLVRYDGERFHRYGQEHGLPVEGYYTVGQDAEGGLWIGVGGTLYCYEGQKFQPVPIEVKVPIRKIQRDQEGQTWFCTSGNGVLCHDGTQFHNLTTRDGLAYDLVNAVFQDREGQFWFATWGGGLSCYDPSIQVLEEKDGLPFNTVTTLTEDHQGRIWMGFTPAEMGMGMGLGNSKVVSYYDGERLHVLGEEEGLDRCRTLCADSRSRLWASGFGLQQYENGRFRKVELGEGQEHILVSALAADGEGALFLGHWQEGRTGQKRWESPLQISRYEGQKFQTLSTREKIHGNLYISALVPTRQGELWFGLGSDYNVGPGEGLGHWREGEDVRYYTVEDGLVDNRVTDLIEDRRGHLWITTHSGVSCFDGTRFRNFTIADGLPSNRVRSVCEDCQGRLWFGTEGGVALYDGHVFQTLRVPEIPSVNDILQDRQGKFWFATIRGAVRYTPAVIPPKVRLLQVLADRVYLPGEEVQLSTSTRQVIFEYKGLSFRTHPRDMLYTCRLQGYEEEWQKPTRSLRVLYQDLPLGDYTFEVRAIDRDLNYSAPASVRLKVIPDLRDQKIDQLEQRVRERTWELEEKNRALEEANLQIQLANQHKSQFLARMSHDLRTPMNAIIGYTRILLRKAKDTLDQRQYHNLENIEVSAQHLLFLINDILDLSRVEAGRIDLKPEPVDLGQLVAQCAASVESLLKPGVQLKQEIAELAPLRTDADRLNRVLMNLLSNAVKFTEAGSITVSLKSVAGWVELSVADTGVGIPAEDLPYIFEEFRQSGRRGEGEKQGSGLGLAIARKSVELLGGSISVDSQVGRGTTFTISLPLQASPAKERSRAS